MSFKLVSFFYIYLYIMGDPSELWNAD